MYSCTHWLRPPTLPIPRISLHISSSRTGRLIVGIYKLNRLNMELDLQSLFGLLCTAVLIGWDPATLPLPHLGSHTRALLVRQDRRHLFVTSCLPETYICPVCWCERLLIALSRSYYAQNLNSRSLQDWQLPTPALPSEENCSPVYNNFHRCCYIMLDSATAESQKQCLHWAVHEQFLKK